MSLIAKSDGCPDLLGGVHICPDLLTYYACPDLFL